MPGKAGPSHAIAGLVSLAFAVGCTEPPVSVLSPRAELTLPAAAADAPALPGPAPRHRTFDAPRVNAACESCHVDIAAEWRRSLHRQAHTDSAYQTQFAEEPFPFCTACHAPEAEPTEAVPRALSELGVGCVTCHVVGSDILAGVGHPERDDVEHPVVRSTAFASAAACAGCHEFNFPTDAKLQMQRTISEHAVSAFSDRSCASCHMPFVATATDGEHMSHAFAASRSEALLLQAADIEVSRDGRKVTFRLKPAGVGHAFPTGDLLRRIALTIEVRDRDGEVVERHQRLLARHFGFRVAPNKPPRRILLRDDRVGVDGKSVEHVHELAQAPRGGEVRYTVRYERLHDPREVASEGLVLAEGVFFLR